MPAPRPRPLQPWQRQGLARATRQGTQQRFLANHPGVQKHQDLVQARRQNPRAAQAPRVPQPQPQPGYNTAVSQGPSSLGAQPMQPMMGGGPASPRQTVIMDGMGAPGRGFPAMPGGNMGGGFGGPSMGQFGPTMGQLGAGGGSFMRVPSSGFSGSSTTPQFAQGLAGQMQKGMPGGMGMGSAMGPIRQNPNAQAGMAGNNPIGGPMGGWKPMQMGPNMGGQPRGPAGGMQGGMTQGPASLGGSQRHPMQMLDQGVHQGGGY